MKYPSVNDIAQEMIIQEQLDSPGSMDSSIGLAASEIELGPHTANVKYEVFFNASPIQGEHTGRRGETPGEDIQVEVVDVDVIAIQIFDESGNPQIADDPQLKELAKEHFWANEAETEHLYGLIIRGMN